MTFTARSSLVALRDAVQAYFDANGVQAAVGLGLRARSKWDTSRVVLVDGAYGGELVPKPLDAGTFGPPNKKQSFNPRELSEWQRIVTACIRAVDKRDLQSEAAQIEAQENLIEWTQRAIWNARDPKGAKPVAGASIEWGKATWVLPPVEFAHGRELLLQFMMRAVGAFDVPQAVQFPRPGISAIVLTGPQSGAGAFVTSALSGVATVTGLAFCTPAFVGQVLTLGGAAANGNNGNFPIVGFNSTQSLLIENVAAVAPDAKNGAITWAVTPNGKAA